MEIQRSFKDESDKGTLYLVATPIGNLQDMTLRALNILKEVDYIAAEDTRNTGQLLKHYEIAAKQISFHEHNAQAKIPNLIQLLEEGKDIAQVSDAGLPSISDPGHDLVKAAIEKSIKVVATPGASAGITALIASGIAPQPYVFYGFLPRKKSQQLQFFEEKKDYPETQIFYESPHRVQATLSNMKTVYGDRQVVLVRELTKIYEEYQRGSLEELLDSIKDQELKGECLLIVQGNCGNGIKSDIDIFSEIQQLIEKGLKPNQAIKQVAKMTSLTRQEVYNKYHHLD